MIKDALNELFIKYHLWRMCNTTGEKRYAHMREMYRRISGRSVAQIRRMESRVKVN